MLGFRNVKKREASYSWTHPKVLTLIGVRLLTEISAITHTSKCKNTLNSKSVFKLDLQTDLRIEL